MGLELAWGNAHKHADDSCPRTRLGGPQGGSSRGLARSITTTACFV